MIHTRNRVTVDDEQTEQTWFGESAYGLSPWAPACITELFCKRSDHAIEIKPMSGIDGMAAIVSHLSTTTN